MMGESEPLKGEKAVMGKKQAIPIISSIVIASCKIEISIAEKQDELCNRPNQHSGSKEN
jgi:hypothetical protein